MARLLHHCENPLWETLFLRVYSNIPSCVHDVSMQYSIHHYLNIASMLKHLTFRVKPLLAVGEREKLALEMTKKGWIHYAHHGSWSHVPCLLFNCIEFKIIIYNQEVCIFAQQQIILKGSYDDFKCCFLFGVLQAVCAKIRSIKLQRLKSQNQRDILYKI